MTSYDVVGLLDLYSNHVNEGMARLMKIMNTSMEMSAEGAYVYDSNNNRYLDCGGYCVFLLGHQNKNIVNKACEQIRTLSLSSRLLLNGAQAKAAKALSDIAPEGLDYVWFANSGAEAVEAAIKICKINNRHNFISMTGGFHGKTTGALSLTHNEKYRSKFLPLMPNVNFVTYGDISSLREFLQVNPGTSSVILEPLQSEAGVIIPPDGYLKAVELACKEFDALLIMDEISTGLGRTGEWWACDSEKVTPDILLCGKALSGGIVPVSGLITKKSLFREFNRNPLLHSSTFSGSPLVSTVVINTIAELLLLNAPKRAKELGDRIRHGIVEIINKINPVNVKEIRGKGLLIGIEFTDECYAGEFMNELLGHRIIVSHSLNSHKTVRFTPSLLLQECDLELLFSAIEKSILTINERYSI